jgi:orotidine-5'-phosphate decarboxylase
MYPSRTGTRYHASTTAAKRLGVSAQICKAGLQPLAAEGASVKRELVVAGKQVFLDLRLLEIPNSVVGAVAAAGKPGVSMVTVQASDGTCADTQVALSSFSKSCIPSAVPPVSMTSRSC